MWVRLFCPHAYLCKLEGIEEYNSMIKIHTGVGLVRLILLLLNLPARQFRVCSYVRAFCRDHLHAGTIHTCKNSICCPLIRKPVQRHCSCILKDHIYTCKSSLNNVILFSSWHFLLFIFLTHDANAWASIAGIIIIAGSTDILFF